MLFSEHFFFFFIKQRKINEFANNLGFEQGFELNGAIFQNFFAISQLNAPINTPNFGCQLVFRSWFIRINLRLPFGSRKVA